MKVRGGPGGFTLLEVTVVLLVVALTLAIGAQGYGSYLTRTAARRSAETFARDLTVARSAALRARRSVVVRVDEATREYRVETSDGRLLLRRDYGAGQDVRLDSLILEMPGDSLVFNVRGILDLSGAGSPLGTAVFRAGDSRYLVSFNSMGTSRVDESS